MRGNVRILFQHLLGRKQITRRQRASHYLAQFTLTVMSAYRTCDLCVLSYVQAWITLLGTWAEAAKCGGNALPPGSTDRREPQVALSEVVAPDSRSIL